MPDENRKFVGVDKWMREFLKKVEVVKDVMEVCGPHLGPCFGSLETPKGRKDSGVSIGSPEVSIPPEAELPDQEEVNFWGTPLELISSWG